MAPLCFVVLVEQCTNSLTVLACGLTVISSSSHFLGAFILLRQTPRTGGWLYLRTLTHQALQLSTHPGVWHLQVATERLCCTGNSFRPFGRPLLEVLIYKPPFYSSSLWERGNEVQTHPESHRGRIHSFPGSRMYKQHCSLYPITQFAVLLSKGRRRGTAFHWVSIKSLCFPSRTLWVCRIKGAMAL